MPVPNEAGMKMIGIYGVVTVEHQYTGDFFENLTHAMKLYVDKAKSDGSATDPFACYVSMRLTDVQPKPWSSAGNYLSPRRKK